MPHVDNSILLNRFWMTADMEGLAQADIEVNHTKFSPEETKRISNSDGLLTSLVGDDPIAEQHIDRVKIFAATHEVSDDQKDLEQKRFDVNCEKVSIDFDTLADDITRLAMKMNERLPVGERFKAETVADDVSTALRRILVSKDVSEICDGIEEPRMMTAHEALAIKNATLGIASMLQKGKIDANAALYYLDETTVFDLRNTADLLKVCQMTQKHVAETFVDKAGVDRVVEDLRVKLKTLRDGKQISEAQYASISSRVEWQLFDRGAELVAGRSRAVEILTRAETTHRGGILSDNGHQRDELKKIKESFRAFRYDLDLCRDVKMSRTESLRRKMDDLGFNSAKRPRIRKDDYQDLKELEKKFNNELDGIELEICQAMRNTAADKRLSGDELPRYEGVDRFKSVDKLAEETTSLTHEANDAIRAHLKGADDFTRDMGAILKSIRRGGSKTVKVAVGADFGFGSDKGPVKGKVGADYIYTVTVSVPKGGGPYTVTKTYEGQAKASVGGKAGSAELSGVGSGGAGGGKSVTLASPDGVISHLRGSSILTSDSAGAVIWHGITKTCRWLGSKVARFLRWTGLLAKPVTDDNNAFKAHLKKTHVVRDVDGFLSVGKNAVVKSERSFKFGGGGGTLTAKSQKDAATIWGVSGGVNVRSEFGVSKTAFTSAVNGLLDLAEDELLDKVLDARESLVIAYADSYDQDVQLAALIDDTVRLAASKEPVKDARTALDRLDELITGYEKSGNDKAENATKVDWRRLAGRFKTCARLYALVEKKLAEALPPGRAREAELYSRRRLFTKRLSNPAVAFPEEVFRASFLVARSAADVPHTTTTIKIDGQFQADILAHKEAMEKDGVLAPLTDYTRQLTGKSSHFTGKLVIDKPRGQLAARPWKNHTKATVSLQVNSSTPIMAAVRIIAQRIVEAQSATKQTVDEVADDIMNVLGEEMIGPLAGSLVSCTVGKIVASIPKFAKFINDTTVKVGKAVEKFMKTSPVLPEIESKSEQSVALNFAFIGTHLQSFALTNETSSSMQIGARSVLGPGVHVRTETAFSSVDRITYPRMTLDTALEKLEEFTLADRHDDFRTFASDNFKGMLTLFDDLASDQTSAATSERLDDFEKLVRERSAEPAVKAATERLASARENIRKLGGDAQASDADKLNALAAYLDVLTAAYKTVA